LDNPPLAREVALEGGDRLELLRLNPFTDQRGRKALLLEKRRMHTHRQHFLVMAAVEDADAPARRQGADDAPKEVVSEVLRTRRREHVTCTPCGFTPEPSSSNARAKGLSD
jgi:hypothetical protein